MSILDLQKQYGVSETDPLDLEKILQKKGKDIKPESTLSMTSKSSDKLPIIAEPPKPKIGIQLPSIDPGQYATQKTVNPNPTTGIVGGQEKKGLMDGLKGAGGAVAANAGGIMSFGLQSYEQLSQEAQSDGEADARTLGLTASGAQLGMQVAGPWGALGGAVIGGTAGLLKKAPDRIKRVKKAYGEYEGKLFDEKNQRDALAEDDERLTEIESQKALQKSQMGLINLNY